MQPNSDYPVDPNNAFGQTPEPIQPAPGQPITPPQLPGQSFQPTPQQSAQPAATPAPIEPLQPPQPVQTYSAPQQAGSSVLPQVVTSDFEPAPAPATQPQPQPQPLPEIQYDNTPPPVNPAYATTYFNPQPAQQGIPQLAPSPKQGFFKNITKSPKKLAMLVGGVVILVGVGYAAYYYGYYTNSSLAYSQSLSNTGKAFNALTDAFTKKNTETFTNYGGSGNFSVKTSLFSGDGNFKFATGSKGSDSNLNMDLMGNKFSLEAMTVKGSDSNPDIYIKASGLSTIPDLSALGVDASAIKKIDGQWIVIDHTLIDTLEASSGGSSSMQSPTEAQVASALKAMGQVNQKYLLSTNGKYNVLVVQKKLGIQTINGHKTYHYIVGFNPLHTRSYLAAQKAALMSSALGGWLKSNNLTDSVNSTFTDMENSALKIKSTDNFELWSDLDTRLIYKVRIHDSTDPSHNYTDIGSGYNGGDAIPLFVYLKSGDSSSTVEGLMNLSFNQKTGASSMNIDFESKPDNSSFKLTFNLGSLNSPPAINAPSGAISLDQALNDLGLGSVNDLLGGATGSTGGSGGGGLSTLGNITGSTSADDSKRQTDIQSIQTQLEAYFSQNGYYPSLTDMNSSSWRARNMSSLDPNALQGGPSGSATTLAAKPGKNVYSYQVTNTSGGSCEADDTTCSMYTLTATLSDGSTYTKTSLN